MQKFFLILLCLLPIGCARNTYNIAPVFHSEGTVAIDGRVDADDPRVTVTVDDVSVDWKDLKPLIEKKMASLQKEPSQQTELAPAQAPLSPALTPSSVDSAVTDAPPRMTHSVQVGAYRHLENAEEQVARLTAKGYPAQLFEMRDPRTQTWYTVRIGDYPSAESARTIAAEFSRREKMESFVRPIERF